MDDEEQRDLMTELAQSFPSMWGAPGYPCEHADLIDITSFCDSVFGQTGLVRSDKEVPWFSQRFSTLSPKGQLQPS
jgi:hypothetical protein